MRLEYGRRSKHGTRTSSGAPTGSNSGSKVRSVVERRSRPIARLWVRLDSSPTRMSLHNELLRREGPGGRHVAVAFARRAIALRSSTYTLNVLGATLRYANDLAGAEAVYRESLELDSSV